MLRKYSRKCQNKAIFIKTNKEQSKMPKRSSIYKNEKSTAKLELYLQKQRKKNQKWKNEAIIKLNNTNSHSNSDNTEACPKNVSNDSYLPYFLALQEGKYRKTVENVKKKKLSSLSSFLC